MNDEIQNRDGGAVQPREAIRSGAGLEELEAALQVLIRHAGRDGGYSPYYGQWQDILHGLGQLISAKRRDLSNTQSSPMPGQKTMNPPEPAPRRRPGFRPSKLTDQQVIEIRYRWNSLERVEDIARDYSITPAYVAQIGTLKRRASVPEVKP